jgi:hypothetical protein
MGLRCWRGGESCTKRFDTPHTFEKCRSVVKSWGCCGVGRKRFDALDFLRIVCIQNSPTYKNSYEISIVISKIAKRRSVLGLTDTTTTT